MVTVLLATLVAPHAFAAGRVALLIGNAAYKNPQLELRNPANDANGLAEALKPLGFDVTVLLDADLDATRAGLAEFEAKASAADMALFFFAGHGVQIEGENHLLTAGFGDLTLDEVGREAIVMSDIRNLFNRAKPKVGLVILDACRNNPFSESGTAARGLARSQGGSGILIAYATDPGNVAYDGMTENSFFTEALIDHIAASGVEARLMFGRVRQQVALTSRGMQVPWVEESVLGEHFFNPGPSSAPLEAEVSRDVQSWRSTSAMGDRAAYEAYLAAFPEGLFRPFAQERIARLEAGPSGAAPQEAPEDLLATADRETLVVALSTLGFLTQTRGQPATTPEIEGALAAYGRQMTDDGQADIDGLYLDAAQVTVVLGATTAQRIRTDLAALTSISTTLDMAGRARSELAALAEIEESAKAALPAADEDIAAIRGARDKVLARLDQSREFYDELLDRGQSALRPYIERSLAQVLERSRGLPAMEQRVVDNAGLFIRPATTLAAETPEGSYAWITDFLPRDQSQN